MAAARMNCEAAMQAAERDPLREQAAAAKFPTSAVIAVTASVW